MLDERKLKVLRAVINSYIASAEPIASKTILKDYDFGVSSATIRNEMSDLETLGYLNKPHTSAGRVPSDKAYRLYVNYILSENIKLNFPEAIDFESVREDTFLEIEDVLKNVSRLLSSITSYTALVISPQTKIERLKHIELTYMGNDEVLIVLVTDTNNVRTGIFKNREALTGEELLLLCALVNQVSKGLDLEAAYKALDTDVLKLDLKFRSLIESIRDLVRKTLDDTKDMKIFTDGVNNIFRYPEYNNLEKARSLISFIEDRDMLLDAILESGFNQGLDISIGDENDYDPLKESTLITTTYVVGDRTIGKIGVVGPTRMDYITVINLLDLVSVNLGKILKGI